MRRREFIAGLGGAAAWPVVARTQQGALPVVGFLSAQSAEVDYKDTTLPFLQGLKDAGYVEGQNVAVEYRYAQNQLDRLPALAADLVRRRVAVIVATAITVARAAKAATTTIPIVFFAGGDPVADGSCRELRPARREPHRRHPFRARDGGETSAVASRVDSQCGPVRRSRGPCLCEYPIDDCRPAGGGAALGLQLVVVNASADRDFEPAFAAFSQQRVGAVVVGTSTLLARRTEQLAALAARHALPASVRLPRARWGGLMSYGEQPQLRMPPTRHSYRAHSRRRASRQTYRCSGSQKSSWSSTSRLPRRSASLSRKRCWPPPTRSFNDARGNRSLKRACCRVPVESFGGTDDHVGNVSKSRK